MNFISLLSSGIDSPVATYLMSKYASEIILIHADNRPYTDDNEINNFLLLSKHLNKISNCKISGYIVPHGEALSKYLNCANKKFTCIFCKRMMLRYAEIIANNKNAKSIIMGDSLGQVASQTLRNLNVVDKAVKLPILRPLIGLDKEDIVLISKNIGTYDLSIQPTEGCKAVPIKPSTHAKLDDIINEENKIDIDNIAIKMVNNSKKLII